MHTRRIIFMLICAMTVLWAVPSFSDDTITITRTLKAVIPNDVPKISADKTEQTLKKGQPIETITITAVSGDWIEWFHDLPSGLTATLPGTITGTPSGFRNGTYTYSVTASNDAGRTKQAITLTISGSNVDQAFLTDNDKVFTPLTQQQQIHLQDRA